MNDDYQAFMPGHPFINTRRDNLLEQLTRLVENPRLIQEKGRAARQWALEHHHLDVVGNQLYGYYRQLGIPI